MSVMPAYLSVVFVTGVVPDAFAAGKIEVIYLLVSSLAWFPVFGQWCLQTFPCYPEEIFFLFYVHAKPFRIFKDLLFGWFVIFR
jgi:hypothetical protein